MDDEQYGYAVGYEYNPAISPYEKENHMGADRPTTPRPTTPDGAHLFFTAPQAIAYALSVGFVVAQSDPDKLNGYMTITAQRYDVPGGYELEKTDEGRFVWRRFEIAEK